MGMGCTSSSPIHVKAMRRCLLVIQTAVKRCMHIVRTGHIQDASCAYNDGAKLSESVRQVARTHVTDMATHVEKKVMNFTRRPKSLASARGMANSITASMVKPVYWDVRSRNVWHGHHKDCNAVLMDVQMRQQRGGM